jgi:hypothetical protein
MKADGELIVVVLWDLLLGIPLALLYTYGVNVGLQKLGVGGMGTGALRCKIMLLFPLSIRLFCLRETVNGARADTGEIKQRSLCRPIRCLSFIGGWYLRVGRERGWLGG